MARFEYTGDGTVDIPGLGGVSPGDVLEVPDSFDLSARTDFKASSGSGEPDAVIVEPVKQPNQDPEAHHDDAPQNATPVASTPASAAAVPGPVASTPESTTPVAPTASASTTTSQGA